MLVLSDKYKDFLKIDAEFEALEGTTAAGKTTVGTFKFVLKVISSNKKSHVIAGADIGTIEKNIINAENGILEQFEGVLKYYPNGKGGIRIPHLEILDKIIYICGYDNKTRWQKVLGSQVGCVYIDECNIADMEFVREISHRCDYMMTTNNPDSPDLPIYIEYINKCRPLKKYVKDYPQELLDMLNEKKEKSWIHWYFTFNDNASLTQEQIEKKKRSIAPGTKMYKNKILGLRGKATGLVFDSSKCIYIKALELKEQLKNRKIKIKYWSIGCDTSYSNKTHDKLTFVLVGISEDKKCYIVRSRAENNAEKSVPFAPSDVIPKLVQFADECTLDYGFVKNIFIDSADAATIAEAKKYKRNNPGCLYDFQGAWKKTKNETRVQLQRTWMFNGDLIIIEDDNYDYRKELDTYSYTEDGKIEDKNDHSIQGGQYAWLPYKKVIGNWDEINAIIKDDAEDKE